MMLRADKLCPMQTRSYLHLRIYCMPSPQASMRFLPRAGSEYLSHSLVRSATVSCHQEAASPGKLTWRHASGLTVTLHGER